MWQYNLSVVLLSLRYREEKRKREVQDCESGFDIILNTYPKMKHNNVKATGTGDISSDIPQLPQDWDRCHAYNTRKRRYCRQMPIPLSSGQLEKCTNNIDDSQPPPRYCGNHRHLMDEWLAKEEVDANSKNETKRPRTNSHTTCMNNRGKRVPCPIDPSHYIYESAISKHILVCPAVKLKQEAAKKEYYCEGINLGGFGEMGCSSSNATTTTITNTTMDMTEAKDLAVAILRVFHHIFLPSSSSSSSSSKDESAQLSIQQLQSITEQDIYNALPEVDLSSVEEGSSGDKLTNAISRNRIRAGGPKHIHQIASILGHVRKRGMISTSTNPPLIVELGAGRGMTGLIVTGAAAANSSQKVALCLVERSGSRGKAETRARTAAEGKQSADDCLRLDLVDVTRVKCDLAHVDMSKALTMTSPNKIVIAKHLCGAGTDLALKSLRNAGKIDGCIMATCCHGLCTWNEYVGRKFFLDMFCIEAVGGLPFFGERQFSILKRWTSASVLEDRPSTSKTNDTIKLDEEHHNDTSVEDKGRYPNIFAVVNELGFACGGNGLGRACQRLIDHGRCEYMRNHLNDSTTGEAFDIDMVHYCSRDITPQNALIVASKKT